MISDSPLYSYEAMAISKNPSHRETRLITLQPGAWHEPIAISFERVSLRHKKFSDFEALSYCWGDPGKVEEVKVEQGGVLHITENLSLALRHLRYQTKTRKLWIDGLCINQKDKEEKSAHVAWMGHIYQMAPKVIVFLGELGARDALAMDLLVTYGKGIIARWEKSEYDIKKGREQLFVKDTKTPKLSQDKTDDINSLMSRPWFSRLWVIQEVALMKNPKTSIVQCGNKSVSWKDFLQGYLVMSINPPGKILRPGSKLAALKSVPEPSYFLCDPSWDINIIDVFWGIQEFQCSEPLDRFYGVLSLLNIKRSECDNNKRLNYDIDIDYDQSPENLFEKIQRIEIEITGLHLLRFCELEAKTEEELAGLRQTRSWVPMPAKVLSFLAVILPNPMIRFKSKHCFHNDGSLEVYGESIGSVVNIVDCKSFVTEWSNGADLAFVLNKFYYLYTIESFRTQNKDLETTLMAIIDVLNRYLYDESSPGYDHASRNDVRTFVSKFCDQKRRDPTTIPEIKGQTLRLAAAQVSKNLNKIFRKPEVRKPPVLYITDKGDIGLGTSATTEGDQVCAIYGVPNFMILRPDGGIRYRVVGPTCVSDQTLAEAILGRFADGHDNTWVVYDAEKKLNVLKRDGEIVADSRLSGFSDNPDFQTWEFDIDTNQSSLAEKLKKNRQSFLLT